MRYLMATLTNGETVISEFSKLSNVQRYIAQVFAGTKPFNVWIPVGTEHPQSGEPCLVRRREMISGSMIARVQEVEPVGEDHGHDPANFNPITLPQSGEYGSWTCPDNEDTPEGAVAGARYPVHRDPNTLRRFVFIRFDAENPENTRRHWLDPQSEPSYRNNDPEGFEPGDADDEW